MARDDGSSSIEVIRPGAIPAPLGEPVGAAGGGLLDARDIDPDAIVAHARKVSEVIDKLAAYALSLTEPRHWVAYKEKDGKSSPWLTAPGAEMMIAKLSLQVEYDGAGFDVVAYEDEIRTDGGAVQHVRQYMMTCKLRVSIGNWASIVCEGHTTTKDPFFSRGGRLKGAQVDLGNVRQAAYSNALCNGVSRLLGLRRLTWDDVRRITNNKVGPDNVDSATFDRGGKGGKGRQDSKRPATKGQVSAVWNRWVAVMRYDPAALPDDVQEQFGAWASDTLRRLDAKDYKHWTEQDLRPLHDRLDAMRDAAPPPVDDGPPPPDESEAPAADEPPQPDGAADADDKGGQ